MARNKYKIARRSIWFVLRTLLVIAGIVALCLGMFIGGMHMSNIYILATEGLEARAETILKNGEPLELSTFFTEDFIANDAALYAGTYADFTVAGFDYRVEIREFSLLPWNVRATMIVDDELAALNAAPHEMEGNVPELPEWTPCRYRVTFVKDGSRWYIAALTLLEENPEVEAKPTPDYSLLTPDPSALPAPLSPTLSPAGGG